MSSVAEMSHSTSSKAAKQSSNGKDIRSFFGGGRGGSTNSTPSAAKHVAPTPKACVSYIYMAKIRQR